MFQGRKVGVKNDFTTFAPPPFPPAFMACMGTTSLHLISAYLT